MEGGYRRGEGGCPKESSYWFRLWKEGVGEEKVGVQRRAVIGLGYGRRGAKISLKRVKISVF